MFSRGKINSAFKNINIIFVCFFVSKSTLNALWKVRCGDSKIYFNVLLTAIVSTVVYFVDVFLEFNGELNFLFSFQDVQFDFWRQCFKRFYFCFPKRCFKNFLCVLPTIISCYACRVNVCWKIFGSWKISKVFLLHIIFN